MNKRRVGTSAKEALERLSAKVCRAVRAAGRKKAYWTEEITVKVKPVEYWFGKPPKHGGNVVVRTSVKGVVTLVRQDDVVETITVDQLQQYLTKQLQKSLGKVLQAEVAITVNVVFNPGTRSEVVRTACLKLVAEHGPTYFHSVELFQKFRKR